MPEGDTHPTPEQQRIQAADKVYSAIKALRAIDIGIMAQNGIVPNADPDWMRKLQQIPLSHEILLQKAQLQQDIREAAKFVQTSDAHKQMLFETLDEGVDALLQKPAQLLFGMNSDVDHIGIFNKYNAAKFEAMDLAGDVESIMENVGTRKPTEPGGMPHLEDYDYANKEELLARIDAYNRHYEDLDPPYNTIEAAAQDLLDKLERGEGLSYLSNDQQGREYEMEELHALLGFLKTQRPETES